MFEGFDFSDFWATRYDRHVELPTDALITEVEQELGYKLPASYIWLMKQHNGGRPRKTACPSPSPTSWAEDHGSIHSFLSIGKEDPDSLCGKNGSKFWMQEWEYPNIGVAIATCYSAGHHMIFLDYRECGKDGEPAVVWVDQEADYRITKLANNFEEFIRSLRFEEEYHNPPLCWAVRVGKTEEIKNLLAQGADVNTQNEDGETPLILAVRNSRADIVNILLQAKADVNKPNSRGETALMVACGMELTEVGRALVTAGADVNYKDRFGKSILKTAEQKGYTEIADLLKSAGAKE